MTEALLEFPAHEVRALLEHAHACREHDPSLQHLCNPAFWKEGRLPHGYWPALDDVDLTRVPAGLCLIGDCSIYLRSNGLPRDIVSRETPAQYRIAYAIGFGPDPDEAAFAKKMHAMGGDDQNVFLDAAAVERALLDGRETLQVLVRHNGLFVTEAIVQQ